MVTNSAKSPAHHCIELPKLCRLCLCQIQWRKQCAVDEQHRGLSAHRWRPQAWAESRTGWRLPPGHRCCCRSSTSPAYMRHTIVSSQCALLSDSADELHGCLCHAEEDACSEHAHSTINSSAAFVVSRIGSSHGRGSLCICPISPASSHTQQECDEMVTNWVIRCAQRSAVACANPVPVAAPHAPGHRSCWRR